MGEKAAADSQAATTAFFKDRSLLNYRNLPKKKEATTSMIAPPIREEI